MCFTLRHDLPPGLSEWLLEAEHVGDQYRQYLSCRLSGLSISFVALSEETLLTRERLVEVDVGDVHETRGTVAALPTDDLMTGTTESGRCFTARSRVACKGLGKGYSRQDQRCDNKTQVRCAYSIPRFFLLSTVTFSVRLHMTHSKVRVSPADPDVTSESVIGPWHFGHGGRSSTVKLGRERAFCDMVSLNGREAQNSQSPDRSQARAAMDTKRRTGNTFRPGTSTIPTRRGNIEALFVVSGTGPPTTQPVACLRDRW